MKNNEIRFVAFSAIIAAIYATVTVMLAPISFGAFQFRLSEGLNLVAFFMPEAIPGLAIGCLIANIIGGGVPADVIVGSVATLLAALFCYKSKNLFVSGIYPVIFNTVMVAPIIVYYYMGGGNLLAYLGYMGIFALCEAASVYAVGIPLALGVKRALKLKKPICKTKANTAIIKDGEVNEEFFKK